MKSVPVEFIVPFHVYNIGDIAGFPRERADALIKSKLAVEHVVASAPVAEPTPVAAVEPAPPADKPKKTAKAKKVAADDETF
jgi:hypothetical protein